MPESRIAFADANWLIALYFLSFDSASGCRAVAADLGFRVFPELNEQARIMKFGSVGEVERSAMEIDVSLLEKDDVRMTP